MPHIIFENQELKKLPFNSNGVFFEFIAKSCNENYKNEDYKICVKDKDKLFLLSLKEKNNNLIIKPDKVTRLSPVSLMKKSLNYFIKLNNANILSSNTNNDNYNKEEENIYLKDINYFVNEFKASKDIQIEVGFGSGRHLLYQAIQNPNIQFIGVEIHYTSIEQVLKQIKLKNINNILIVNYDARLVMEFIQSNSVSKIFVHFPVPWDKKPHRRVYSYEFVNECLRILKKNATLELRTDSRNYFDFCLNILTNLPKAKLNIDINKDLEISSKYEDRWKKQGKNIYDIVITSLQEDSDTNLFYSFSFNIKQDFNKLKDKMNIKPIIEDLYFVHIEDIYILIGEKNSGLIKVTMGNFDRPITKYLLVRNNKISYFQGNPIPTSANIEAHKKLLEYLEE